MKLKQALRYHKNTIVGVLSAAIWAYLTFEYVVMKAYTFSEYAANLGMVAGAVATIIGFLAPDGKNETIRQENRQAIIDELKAQLKQENEKAIPSCDCGTPADCLCVLKKGPDQLGS